MKKRMLAAALAATLSVTMLSGCGKTESASNTNPSETAEEAVEEEAVEEDALREVNVVLDWYPNAIHAFLYTAIERGYFKEAAVLHGIIWAFQGDYQGSDAEVSYCKVCYRSSSGCSGSVQYGREKIKDRKYGRC